MRGYLDRGYTTVKMKIGGRRWKKTCVALKRKTELGPEQRLAVDANGRFDTGTAIAYYAKALSPYDLFWYEEARRPA